MRIGLLRAIVLLVMAAATVGAVERVRAAPVSDHLSLGMQLEPPHLDPTAGAATAIAEVTYANLYEGLTRINADGRVIPGLARQWDVADDGLAYTFHLREAAAFHDGHPFEAADIRFSLDRARVAESVNPQKGYFASIGGVDTPDPHTVVVHLTRPDPLLLFHLAQPAAVIVGRASADGNKRHPIGTGPFKFERWVVGDRIELVRNSDYDGPKPALAGVTFRFINDAAAQVAALKAGDIDSFPQFGTYEALPDFRADSRFRVMVGSTEGKTLLSTNNARKPFDDVRVRRAMAYAIDRQSLIEGAMYGTAKPIGSHFSPNHPAYVDLTGLYPFDPGRARALLTEAGYPQGFEAVLTLPPPIYARRTGELVAAMLADVGIRLKIETVEWAVWLDRVFREHNYDLTIIAHTEPLDIDIYGRASYYFNYHSDQFNTGLAALATTMDEAARNRIYGDLQRLLAEDAVNGFLFQLPAVTVENAKIVGMWLNRPVPSNDVTAVHWVP